MHVLLSADPGGLAPAEIVEGYDWAAGLPPLSPALGVESPQKAEYLIPKRASGAFAAYLVTHPDSTRARLERYIVLTYPEGANLSTARSALLSEAYFEHAYVPAAAEFAIPPGSTAKSTTAVSKSAWSDWHDSVNASDAWALAGGWALVGTIDNGIASTHVNLASFSNGTYTGGNFLPSLSFDVGRTGLPGCVRAGDCIESNVDDAQPAAVALGSACDVNGTGSAAPAFAGHGTHVAGLIAATARNESHVEGACRHCGLMPWRVTRDECLPIGLVRPKLYPAPIDAATVLQADLGAQVINQSFGRATVTDPAHCQANPLNSECLALAHALERGVMLVAASGNNRTALQFPASQRGLVAAGGLGKNLALWDRDTDAPPNHLDECPQPPAVPAAGLECGSNFTIDAMAGARQEVAAPAEDIRSTTYPGLDWNFALGCGDTVVASDGAGVGTCTGTSMASPITAGIAGLLRSINPLVPPGDPDNAADALGVSDVIASTSAEAQKGFGWQPQLGYGRPDAYAAAQRMLGTVRGTSARNRAIPLFDFHSAAATDYAVTATPQIAMTLAVTEPWVWSPRGPAIAGYPAYPIAPNGVLPAPHASVYVLSTEYRTDPKQPPLIPLYLLSRSRPWPLGCTPGTFQCKHANRDFMLVNTVAALETAVADGYAFFGRQGYVFQRCTPEPSCIPPAATRLYRQCNTAEDDCAVFLENELAAFQSLGYTAAWPPGSDPVMGYAYANADTDGDTLIDGFERLIGTNAASADSDGDGAPDGLEYPLAGVPLSDPCAGPSITCTQEAIFHDGYE